jgi:molybdopterin-guanine dinucleotide biosynthesis protein A
VTVLLVVIAFAVCLLLVVIVAVAREPGPGPADVAIGYARAVGAGDFDAMYRMIDPDLMQGRNRLDWIAAAGARPHVVFDPNGVRAVTVEVAEESAHVDVALDADRVVPVDVVRKNRVWVITTFDGAGVVRPSSARAVLGGVLLTGGTSRRLGVDKATLLLDGETLAARAARLLTEQCDMAVEVGPGHTTLDVVREVPPGAGPLAALATGTAALLGRAGALTGVVLLACDLPAVAPALAAVAHAPAAPLVVAVDAGARRNYVCARYGPAVAVRAIELTGAGVRSLRELVATVSDAEVLELGGFAPDVLADVDTPDDARRWGIAVPPVASGS